MILFDTNVVSEFRKPKPNPRVAAWVDGHDEDCIFLSVVTLAEIRFGVVRLGSGRRRSELEHWADVELPHRFDGRIIDVDRAIALKWGDLMYDAQRKGRVLDAMDGMIAATAATRQLTLATRNTRDFEGLDIDIVDPWTAWAHG